MHFPMYASVTPLNINLIVQGMDDAFGVKKTLHNFDSYVIETVVVTKQQSVSMDRH